MSFFKDLSKKISDVAKEAAKKSSSFMEVTNLSVQIDKEQREIDNAFYEIGKSVYENYSQDSWVESKFGQKMEKIRMWQDNIENLKKEIARLKNIKVCQSCGEELTAEVLFCSKCGAKCPIEEVQKAEEEKDQKVTPEATGKGESDATFKKCKVCTSDNNVEAKFCSKCGAAF